ncbi:MAG: efflux RND transporter permease subunit [Candidatus Saccharibacteria bacterium]|nr:efflux RND transporter permease subunit [Candidatus Saccharibacteria bacterium]
MKNQTSNKKGLFAAIAATFFKHARLVVIGLLVLLIAGGTIYGSVIKREGFPSIQFPLTFVNGFYFVDDKAQVDQDIAQPFYQAVKDLNGVETVQTTANANDFTGVVYFEESVTPQEGAEEVRQAIEGQFPEQAQFNVISIDPAAYLNKYDMLLTVYGENGDVAKLQEVAGFVAEDIEGLEEVTLAEPQPLISESENSATGEPQPTRTSFNRVGLPDNGGLEFSNAVTIGVDRDQDKYDVIELSEAVQAYLNDLDLSQFGEGYDAVIGADFAESINTQINSLQDNLFTGLIAVAVVSLLLITWRASIITAVFMVTVMAATIAILFAVGYTLNTITLFALVLSLGLFVDDATIVVEAIDAAKRKRKKGLRVVKEAVGKIGAASFAGTFTTVLVFLPLAFISGVLGEFIRLLPITVIIALVASLALSLTVIPVLSKFLLLRSDKKSLLTKMNPVAFVESWLGRLTGALPRTLKTRPKLGRGLAVFMVLLSIAGLIGALGFAGRVPFNIFPSSKDSNQIGVTLDFPEGHTIERAEATSQEVEQIIEEEAGDLVRRVTYGSFSIVQPNERSADILVDLIPFNERDRTSQDIIAALQTELNRELEDTRAKVVQYDAGPPVDDYPFKVQIYNEDEAAALRLAEEVREYIEGATITRPNGTEAEITDTNPPGSSAVRRSDGRQFVEITAAFNAGDTSALLVAAEDHTKEKFTDEYLENNGYRDTEISYDFGQESENAESFAALGVVFPVALGLMYVLLAVQFRSLLQPLLIFVAIPFTFLGVFAGLHYTDNGLSFFVMVGLIGLIGIAVNNTILLTTYINQERAAGEVPIDAAANAVTKRFRPLLATTLTTIVALLPLALTDPFWEPLAFTIIFGLASSTFFVLVSFPYYYLGFERLRRSVKAKKVALWLLGLVGLLVYVGIGNSSYVLAVLGLYAVSTILLSKLWAKIGM